MREIDLPQWPTRGTRRKLDRLWLEALERGGSSIILAGAPATPPPELSRAIEEFNGELFWRCHETLEGLWLNTPYPLRLFYHAVIKAAVGFHHLSRHNRLGARVKLADAVRLLRLMPPSFLGVLNDRLCQDASEWLERLEGAGSIVWRELDDAARPSITVVKKGLGEEGPQAH